MPRKRKAKPWYVRTKTDEVALSKGYYYEPGRGEFYCDFIEKFCPLTKGRKAGESLKLLDWQREIILLLYNWRRPDGTRRFRTVYCEIPKKNGKSFFVAPLNLAEALFGDQRGEHYLCAGTRDQAKIIFREIAALIKASPILQEEFELKEYYSQVICHRTGTTIQVVSGDPGEADNKDGLDATFVTFDELHRQADHRLWDVYKYAGVGRAQPVKFVITTAGDRRSGVCWEQHEKSLSILSGENDWELAHLPILYCAQPDDDLDDPKTWRKANPSLGITLSEEDFRQELLEAKQIPRNFDLFKRLRLNIWTEGDSSWLPIDRWKEAEIDLDPDLLYGQPCFLAVDLSYRTDLTAMNLLFPQEDGYFTTLPFFWIPSESVDRKEEMDRVPYQQWVREGRLTLCPGDVISYQMVVDKIKELCTLFDVQSILFDPWQARILCEQLRNEGYPVLEFHQTASNFNLPCKTLETLILERKIRHGGNPILTWNLGSVVVKEDDKGAIRPDRKRKKGRDDGAVALLMGLGGALNEEARKGLYRDTRIITL